jgi:hypothetical protein
MTPSSPVIPVNVLVVFFSRYGDAERLALAAGVGAIEARASIRLRRVADLTPQDVIDADPARKEHQDRMKMDYVAPREPDPQWADVIILAAPPEATQEVEQYVRSLKARPYQQIAAPLHASLHACACDAGFLVVPARIPVGSHAREAALQHGKRVAEIARTLKSATSPNV